MLISLGVWDRALFTGTMLYIYIYISGFLTQLDSIICFIIVFYKPIGKKKKKKSTCVGLGTKKIA
jgi:hypothetical protein